MDRQTPPSQTDAFARILMDECVNRIPDAPLRQFLGTVFNDPQVSQVLSGQVTEGGMSTGLRVVKLREIAANVLRPAQVNPQEFQAVYVATFLHGIQYLLQPSVGGKNALRDVMHTLVRGALQRLEGANPGMANLVRLCMGWGNFDEETVFTEWLQARLRRAISVLDLARF